MVKGTIKSKWVQTSDDEISVDYFCTTQEELSRNKFQDGEEFLQYIDSLREDEIVAETDNKKISADSFQYHDGYKLSLMVDDKYYTFL